MSKPVQRRAKVVRANTTKAQDDTALRKVARAVIAIAQRQLREESGSRAAEETVADEEK